MSAVPNAMSDADASLFDLRVGFEMTYDCPRPTPMLLALHLHPSVESQVVEGGRLVTSDGLATRDYTDGFDNRCTRAVAPAGRTTFDFDAIVRVPRAAETGTPEATQVDVDDLPDDALQFLLGSRYCETDQLSAFAWDRFGNGPTGWGRVAAVCDFVHGHIRFGYEHARRTRTAREALDEGRGVCRDYAHLAVALCRCLNIPARYCTGYITDIDVLPTPTAPMDFAAWFEAYLGGAWHPFDPRNNAPRVGRLLMARGRDASDVALANTFGPNTLVGFKVWADDAKVITGDPRR